MSDDGWEEGVNRKVGPCVLKRDNSRDIFNDEDNEGVEDAVEPEAGDILEEVGVYIFQLSHDIFSWEEGIEIN